MVKQYPAMMPFELIEGMSIPAIKVPDEAATVLPNNVIAPYWNQFYT